MNETNTPLVSLILITYRDFQHVYEAIDSMLAQDYPAVEMIVADDGSADFPGEKIEAYIREHKQGNVSRVEVYSNETNLGTVRNMNGAHAKCKGKYIVALAGDDVFYDEHTVSRIAERMEQTGCGVLAATRFVTDENGNPEGFLPPRSIGKRGSRLTRKQQYERIVSGQFGAMFSGGSLAVRRETFEKLGGYDEKYRLWEDGPFFEKALRQERVEPAFDICMVKYRLGGVSTGTVHPLLQQDVDLYNRTDRIAHLNQVSPFYRALTLYNVGRGGSMLWRPFVLAYKVWYRFRYKLAEKADRKQVSKSV